MQDIKATVRRFVDDNFIMGVGGQTLADSDSFLEGHILDSTGFLELVAFLEETYGIKINDDEMLPENLDTLDSIANFVSHKKAL